MTWRATALLLFLLASPQPTRADADVPAPAELPPPERDASEDSPAYESALAEALAAHARGEFTLARVAMERAHQLSPSARTLRGLGIVAFAQARHVEAIGFLEASLAAREKPLSPALRSAVESLLSHAWAEVARLELLSEPAAQEVSIDGHAPEWHGENTLILTPGPHVIRAHAPSMPDFTLRIALAAGERRTLQLVFATPRVLAPPAGPAVQPTLARPSTPISFWTRPVRVTTYVGGASLLLVGAALWTTAYLRLGRIVDDCDDSGGCARSAALSRFRADNVQGLGIAAAITGGIGSAALLAAVGIDARLWWKRRGDTRAQLGIGPRGVWLYGHF